MGGTRSERDGCDYYSNVSGLDVKSCRWPPANQISPTLRKTTYCLVISEYGLGGFYETVADWNSQSTRITLQTRKLIPQDC